MYRTLIVCILVAASLTGCASCQNPGKVIVSCTMDAVNDPKVLEAVLSALAAADFRAALASLIIPAGRITAEVIACVLRSILGNEKLGATPAGAEKRMRARAYLAEHGYVVP